MARPIGHRVIVQRPATLPDSIEMVQCAHERCSRLMPAKRRDIGLTDCARCTEDIRRARPAAPQYETEVWSQGGRL